MRNKETNTEFTKLIESVVMIPGSCAYLYDTEIVYGNDGEPLNSLDGKESDVKKRIDTLKQEFPNLKNVSVVVGWYFDTTNAGQLTIAPRIDDNNPIANDTWCVGNITREKAQPSVDKQATPSDISIFHVVQYLVDSGYNVTLYPMLFCDNKGQSWRGFINGKSKEDIDHFFEEYKKFILHYAELKIDSIPLSALLSKFIVGSEMKDLLAYDDGTHEYYAVQKMVELTHEVKAIIGEDVKTVYAANWSDYSVNSEGFYHHDPLFEAVDIVGIDVYTPITDGIPQSEITKEVIKAHWEEGINWDYYVDEGERHPISNPKYAIKDFKYWYTHKHINSDGSVTSWKPGEKVVIATEFGYPKVDRCTEEPYDFSVREDVNPNAQQIAIEAGLEYWKELREANPELQNLFPEISIYNIDARGEGWQEHPELYDDYATQASGHEAWIYA